jgi:hypothetical protein
MSLFLFNNRLSTAGFALDPPVHFFGEKRTESYIRYGEGVSQPKNVPEAKKPAGSPALPESRLAGAEAA